MLAVSNVKGGVLLIRLLTWHDDAHTLRRSSIRPYLLLQQPGQLWPFVEIAPATSRRGHGLTSRSSSLERHANRKVAAESYTGAVDARRDQVRPSAYAHRTARLTDHSEQVMFVALFCSIERAEPSHVT